MHQGAHSYDWKGGFPYARARMLVLNDHRWGWRQPRTSYSNGKARFRVGGRTRRGGVPTSAFNSRNARYARRTLRTHRLAENQPCTIERHLPIRLLLLRILGSRLTFSFSPTQAAASVASSFFPAASLGRHASVFPSKSLGSPLISLPANQLNAPTPFPLSHHSHGPLSLGSHPASQSY